MYGVGGNKQYFMNTCTLIPVALALDEDVLTDMECGQGTSEMLHQPGITKITVTPL